MSKEGQLAEEVAKLVAAARPYAAPGEPNFMQINGDGNIQVAGGPNQPPTMTITGDRNRQEAGSFLLVRRPGFWHRFLRYFYPKK